MKNKAIDPNILPRFFVAKNKPQFLFKEAQNFSCVEYKSSEEQRENRFIASSYLFVMIMAGEKIIHTSNEDILLHAGEAFFIQKGAHIFSEILSAGGFYHAAIFFITDDFLGKFLQQYPRINLLKKPQMVPDIFRIKTSFLLSQGFKSLLTYIHSTSSQIMELLCVKLEELLLLSIDADEENYFHSFLHDLHSNKKQSILSLMEKYYDQPLNIADLASLSGRSTSAFKRDFRNLFQESPRQWINKRRLKEAMILLQNSDKNVSDTCFEVGFNNISHFSQIFKKQFGYSPSMVKRAKNDIF